MEIIINVLSESVKVKHFVFSDDVIQFFREVKSFKKGYDKGGFVVIGGTKVSDKS